MNLKLSIAGAYRARSAMGGSLSGTQRNCLEAGRHLGRINFGIHKIKDSLGLHGMKILNDHKAGTGVDVGLRDVAGFAELIARDHGTPNLKGIALNLERLTARFREVAVIEPAGREGASARRLAPSATLKKMEGSIKQLQQQVSEIYMQLLQECPA